MSSITSEAVCASNASYAFTYGPLVCFIWVIKFLKFPWTLPWRRSAFSSYPVASGRPMSSSEMVQLQATDMPRAKWDREGAFSGSTQEFHSPGGQNSPQEGLEPDRRAFKAKYRRSPRPQHAPPLRLIVFPFSPHTRCWCGWAKWGHFKCPLCPRSAC